MLIVCPSCATSYDVESVSLPPQGRQVRCLRCSTIWHTEPSQADRLLSAAAAIAPDPGVQVEDAPDISAEAAIAAAEPVAEAAGDSPPSEQFADEQPDDGNTTDSSLLAAAADDESDPASAASVDEADSDEPIESAEVIAPAIVPVAADDGQPPIEIDSAHSIEHQAELAENIETVASRRPRRAAPRRRMPRWPLTRLRTGILALVLVDAVILGCRSDIVRALPQTASFYTLMGLPVNVRGLTFDDVVMTTEQQEGVPVLMVVGNIVNRAHKDVNVPRLKFVVRNAARQEIYSWTASPSRTALPPGEISSFRTRLASPPPDAHDLVLRFVNRRDIIAGSR
jgi:predicted Zn finger-like uncharacterized protein